MITPVMRRLLQDIVSHKKLLSIIIIAGLLMAATETAVVNLIKNVFDALQNGQTDIIKSTFVWILILAFIKAVSRYLHLFNVNYLSEIVAQGLRQKLQKKFMQLNLTFHNTYQGGSGGLISRILGDVITIFLGIRFFSDLFREPFLFIGLLSTLFYLNWKLTLNILIILPFILWFMKQVSRSVKKYSTAGQLELEKITGTIKETLDGLRTIQSYNLEEEMAKRFKEQSNNFLRARKRIFSLLEGTGPITEYIMTIVIFSIILYMTNEIAAKRATYGDFMAYIAALLALSGPVKRLQEAYLRIQESQTAAERVYQLLDNHSEVPQERAKKKFPKDWKQIHYRGVSFRYGRDWVLKNVSFSIDRGQMVAFVGASGSGKSTLINLLGRFFDPTEGQILIDDVPIEEIELKELRDHIALVTQDVFLFSDSIESNIKAGNFQRDSRFVEAAAQTANAHDFIMKTKGHYSSPAGDRGGLLSGGEKQRISIARAVFKDAPIMILDEATSALDSQSEIEVQKGLDKATEGRTSLVIAHRLSTIARADIIYVLKDGQIVESGTHNELLKKNGDYSHFYKLQYGSGAHG